MDEEILIKRVFEETKLDDEAVLVLAYGSRINGTAQAHSDLDLLAISGKTGVYKQAIIIDGIPIDITIMSIDDAEYNIINAKALGSSYLEAVLKNGQIIIDKIGLYEDLNELVKHRSSNPRQIDDALCKRALNHYYSFFNKEDNSNVNYFSALDLIRRIYQAKHNLPNVQSSKVYNLYTRPDIAHSTYALPLPNSAFIDIYLSALQTHSREVQKIWLKILYKEISEIIPKPVCSMLDCNQRALALINLNSAIWKCEDMILDRHPGALALYYSLIGEIQNLYSVLFNTSLEIDIPLEECSPQQMIDNLEHLFSLVDIYHDIDYNDYKIRVR